MAGYTEITETYSDGSVNVRTERNGGFEEMNGGANALAGGVMAAGVMAAGGLIFLTNTLDSKAEAKYYSDVNAAALEYERSPSAISQQKLLNSLKYLTGAKIKIFGWGGLSAYLKTLLMMLLGLIPVFGLIYVGYQFFKYKNALKGRREAALKIAQTYKMGNQINKYMYSIVGRIFLGYLAWTGFTMILAFVSSLFV